MTLKNQKKRSDLKKQMTAKILISLIIGVILAAVVPSIYMYYEGSNWVTAAENDSLLYQQNNLFSYAGALSLRVQTFLQKISNDLLTLRSQMLMIYQNNIILTVNNIEKNDYGWNAYTLTTTNPTRLQQISDFNNLTNSSNSRSMWFLKGQPSSYSSVTPPINQAKIQYFISLLPLMNSLYNTSYHTSFYIGYSNDGYQNELPGMFTVYPLKVSSSTFGNSTGNPYDFSTRTWWIEMKNNRKSNIENENNVYFITPYQFASGLYGYTACIDLYDFSGNNEIRVLCVDYTTTEIENSIGAASGLMQGASFFIMDTKFQPIIHSNFKNNTLIGQTLNITQIEYNQTTLNINSIAFSNSITQLVNNFQQNNFSTSYNTMVTPTMEYTLNGISRFLTMFPINIVVSNDTNANKLVYLLCLTIPISTFNNEYQNFKSILIQNIYIQIIIIAAIILFLFLIALYIINIIAKSITSPIEDLIRLLKEIDHPKGPDEDNDNDNDAIHIRIKKDDLKSYSKEINDLYGIFLRIKNVMKFSKDGYLSSNDAQALMNYSTALTLYEELNNKRGQGIIHNNIGNLHMKNERIQEALVEYMKAVDIGHQEILEFEEFVKNNESNLINSKNKKELKKKKIWSTSITNDYIESTKDNLEEQYCNRLFQLINCLIYQANKQKKDNWNEIINRLKNLIPRDQKNGKHTSRIIYSTIELANCYLNLKKIHECQNNLEIAEKLIKDMEMQIDEVNHDDKEQEFPIDILKQKLLYQKGMLSKMYNNKKDAAIFFTDAIEYGKIYDPSTRKKCLTELYNLFYDLKMTTEAEKIKKLLRTYNPKNKDIVFVLDYSQSMSENSRINFAIKNILKVFEKYIKSKDRVGFIRFNLNVDVVFPLVEKQKNTLQLRKQIEDSLKPSGTTAFNNAINEALKLFTKCESTNNSKWILALTDGDDNESRIDNETIAKKLYRSDVNLIVVGLNLHKAVIPKLKALCGATTEGVFIESQDSENLDVAFQSITDIIYGQDLITEMIAL